MTRGLFQKGMRVSGEIDYNKIIAETISKNIDKIYESAKGKVSGLTNTIRSRLKRTFTSYLENLNRKYSVTKTLIYRETPQPILSFYEQLDLHNTDIKLKSPKLPDILNLNSPVLITGSGGSGKSTLLKYFLLNALEDADLMPIFIELRYLENKQSTLLDHIAENLKIHTLRLPRNFISSLLSRGGFVIFLDGLDELSSNQSQKISTEIHELVDNQVGNTLYGDDVKP